MDDNNLPDAGEAAPVADGPSGESPAEGATTVRFCANCEQDVEPKGKGSCPKCGRFLHSNVVALVHGGRRLALPPERASQRAALREQVVRELGGNLSAIDGQQVEDYVAGCVLLSQLTDYLENIGPLTERGTRRAAMDLYLATSARVERLTVQLRAIRGDAPKAALSPGLTAMPDGALVMALELWEKVAASETLTDREQGALDVLEAAMRGDIVLPWPEPPAPLAPAPVSEPPATPIAAPAPEPEPPAEPQPAPNGYDHPHVDWGSVPASPETSRFLDLLRRCREGLALKW